MDTHNDNIELLKHHINLVVKDINDIIASNISSAEKSNLINARMRDVKVYLEKTYIDQFLNGDIEKVTIDPSRCKLTESDCNNEPLYTNSFGPFYPEDYFEKDFVEEKNHLKHEYHLLHGQSCIYLQKSNLLNY